MSPRSINDEPVAIVGGPFESGTYVLRVTVAEPLSVRFGRFQNGRPVAISPGDYFYVGSAMARTGSGSLARRLLRHATRSGDRPPQAIQSDLLKALQAARLGPPDLQPPATKTIRWHIDYLLDEQAAQLSQIVVRRDTAAYEETLVNWLEARPESTPVAPGLGASDHRGHSHLFHVTYPATVWLALITQATRL